MLWLLRLLFLLVLGSMIGVTSWASLQQSLFAVPREVLGNPWFIATLGDACCGFLAFYVWVAWKEPRLVARLLWLIAILALGNLAMALYALVELCRIREAGQIRDLLSRRNAGGLVFPGVLVALALAVYGAAWKSAP